MKLLLTLDFPPACGGIQRYLHGIVRYTYTGEDVVFAAGKAPEHPELFRYTAAIRYFAPLCSCSERNLKFSLIAFIFPYLKLCRQFRGRLSVECGNIYAALIPWVLYPLTHQPYALYTYGTELVGIRGGALKSRILRKILAGAEKVYALGTYTQRLLEPVPYKKPCIIVPPRIELPQPYCQREKKFQEPFRILTVGRLMKHKGQRYLIEAAYLLKNRMDCRFIIAGSGPQYQALMSLCKNFHLTELVTIHQTFSDSQLSDEYRLADIFVLPSIETSEGVEGFGMVLLEAMAYKIPVIASNIGGIAEVIDNGNCGTLVEPANAEALAYAIEYVSNDKNYRQNCVEKAYCRLVNKYVWK